MASKSEMAWRKFVEYENRLHLSVNTVVMQRRRWPGCRGCVTEIGSRSGDFHRDSLEAEHANSALTGPSRISRCAWKFTHCACDSAYRNTHITIISLNVSKEE